MPNNAKYWGYKMEYNNQNQILVVYYIETSSRYMITRHCWALDIMTVSIWPKIAVSNNLD